MSLADDLKAWTETDAAVLVLGRALGVFDATTTLADVKAVLWTNSAAGNTLYGMLDRLAWLGVLEFDEEQQRYRVAKPTLHPLTDVADVPALVAGPPARSYVRLAVEGGAFRLEADRAGYRYLAKLFDDIANSGVDSGWEFRRGARFEPHAESPDFTFRLVDPGAEEPSDKS
ncbi:MAG TPA: hypothetical protein VGG33_18945 [Polyangia bacterium]